MERLTSKQRAYLRSLAQRLKPVVFVGKEGISDAVVQAAAEALAAHELIKLRVLRGSPVTARDAVEALAARLPGAHAVQAIGHVGVLYRPHPERPTIALPPARSSQ